MLFGSQDSRIHDVIPEPYYSITTEILGRKVDNTQGNFTL